MNFCMNEDSCSSPTAKEGSKFTLLVATLQSLIVTVPSARGRELQLSFERSLQLRK